MTSKSHINKKILITDTSVLINFLNINKLSLLIEYPGSFLITEHVIEEITIDFPEQQALLNSAINNNHLVVVKVDNESELKMYNELIKEGRLGSGECSAIACAVNRGFSLAMEDVRACKQAFKTKSDIEILKTQDIILTLIMNEIISIEEADNLKQIWQTNFRFALKFNSFSELLEK